MKIQSVVLVLAVALALCGTFYFHYSSHAHPNSWSGDASAGWFEAKAWVEVNVPDPNNHNVGYTTPDHETDVKACVNFDWDMSAETVQGTVIDTWLGHKSDPGRSDVAKLGAPWMVKEAHAKLVDNNGFVRINRSAVYNGGCNCGSSSS